MKPKIRILSKSGQTIFEGYAPNGSRCDCEHVACGVCTPGTHYHEAGACMYKARFQIVAYGHKQNLCRHCLMRAGKEDRP